MRIPLFLRRVVLLVFVLTTVTSPAYALGISQRDGAAGFNPENAKTVVLYLSFRNFYYDPKEVVAGTITYGNVNYAAIEKVILKTLRQSGLQIYDIEKFAIDAKMENPSNGRAVSQLYQDFAQVLKDSRSQLWPLLDKVDRFFLGRQFGNTLARLPMDLTDTYFVVPLGLELRNKKNEVFGFLGIVMADKEGEIVTAAAVRYEPTNYSQKKLEEEFERLAGRIVNATRKHKEPKQHSPRVPELKEPGQPEQKQAPASGSSVASNAPSAPAAPKKAAAVASKQVSASSSSPSLQKLYNTKAVTGVGLARDVDNMVFGVSIDGKGTSFSVNDPKVVWYAEFDRVKRSFKESLRTPKFYAAWYDPNGKKRHEEQFEYAFGNNELARNEFPLASIPEEERRGTWRVVVHYNNDLIYDDTFEVS